MDDYAVRLEARVQALEHGQASLRALVDENTRITLQVRDNTRAIVEAFQSASGFFAIAGWVGKGAKWVISLGAAAVVLWAALKGKT